MILWVLCGIECLIFLLIILISVIRRNREKRRMVRAVQKIMRKNKLESNIRNHRTQEETFQLNKRYLCITFLKTSPRMVWAFDPTVPLTIGRGKPNAVQLRNQQVSKDHCCIFESDGYIYLQNVAALNPLYIKRGILRRRTELPQGQYELLEDKDIIEIAEFRLKLHFLTGREAFVC